MIGALSKLFHKEINFKFKSGTGPSDPKTWPKSWKTVYFKEYPRLNLIPLSWNFLELGNLESALKNRHSTREFSNKPITFEELSTLLYFGGGIRKIPDNGEWNGSKRFYPSGGSRYPLEIYIGAQNVTDLDRGIYHYNVKKHALEELIESEGIKIIKEAMFYPWSKDAALFVILTSVWDRNFIKYKDFGYKIVLNESGHLMQNIALISSALNIGCCHLAGYSNEKIELMLDIDNEEESTVHLSVLGKLQ
ncbi:SagB/ThcOx family dehydrogenase [Candidatus Giovannonibacteria bacterium]|nr:SagB/ThcOx family dehydrogenase [Candidatus Giovannonibacteria bacterium]